MVNLVELEGEVSPAAVAQPLLLPEEDVLVLAVGYGSIDVRAPGNVGAGGDVAVMKEAAHGLLQAHVDQLHGLGRYVYAQFHLRLSLSAATQAVAHPQKGSSTMSPSLELALMIRSSRVSGFCVG